MIIGVDIRVLGNPVKSGIEEYAENLVPHLIKEGGDIQFKLFYSSRGNFLPEYDWLREPNIALYKFSYPNNLLFASSRFLNRPFMDRMIGGGDVFFFPHFFISSLSPSCKRVTTFHDLSYMHFPEHITLRKKIWHNFQMIPEWQAKFSDGIIAVSDSTKNDLINFYKIDPARIEVIYSGVREYGASLSAKSTNSAYTEAVDMDKFKKEKNLPGKFIFFLGKLEPRKNVVNLIRAFSLFKSHERGTNQMNAMGGKDYHLVIAGDKGWMYQDIFREAERSPYRSKIIFIGHVSDEERFSYYRAADVFVYPSFFEGFGFPPLEAMSCGTPVITSRNSSLPEVVGDAAITIDPYDVDELEFWMRKLLEDEILKTALVAKGKERAKHFSWKSTAQKTLDVLTKL